MLDPDMEFTKVTITMPRAMHDALRVRSRRRGISVTELMRRAVALDQFVFDPAHPDREVILREPDCPDLLVVSLAEVEFPPPDRWDSAPTAAEWEAMKADPDQGQAGIQGLRFIAPSEDQ